METSQRWVRVGVLLSMVVALAIGQAAFADEIEILSVTPTPPATIYGVAPWPAGGPIPALTASNSVTVVVGYRTDGTAAGAQAFAARPSGITGFRVADPVVGPDPPCSSISGPSEGRCATAFFYICEEGSPSPIEIELVGASLSTADDRVIVSDYQEADITVSCGPRPPRRDPGNCLVLGAPAVPGAPGVPGMPGAIGLPFSRETPICRCLQDQGAREFRCALLHPDFFMVRRVPLPVPPQQQFAEVWEFLALTEMLGPVTMRLAGAGLTEPVEHVFEPKDSAGGKLSRFVTECVSPEDPAALVGLAEIEFVSTDGQSRTFKVDRTLDEALREQQ